MAASRRVLSNLNGDWAADVMFVAEAPGRLGAELTGIPLFGDRTGIRFSHLLAEMRWERSEIFTTNAVLCNPRTAEGRNDVPSRTEIANCGRLLERTINVVNPIVVIALGRVALEALGRIAGHGCTVREHCGTLTPWGGRYLGVLYHPGPRTQVHRKWEEQLKDARRLAASARELRERWQRVEDAGHSGTR